MRSRRAGGDGLSRLRVFAWIAAAILAAEVLYIALASPRFAIREIVLRGDPAVTRQLAARIALPANTNLFRASKGALKEEVEGYPAVRQADVALSVPSRIIISVERREAAAVVRYEDQAILIDRDGVPFTVPGEWGWGLPELVLADHSAAKVAVGAGQKDIALLLGALRALAPDPRLRPARLQLVGPGHVEATLTSGPQVNLGDSEKLESKLAFLTTTLVEFGPERVEYLDLADPDAAFWRPRETPAAAPVR